MFPNNVYDKSQAQAPKPEPHSPTNPTRSSHMESSAPPEALEDTQITPRRPFPSVHALEAIIRLANNHIGLDSRDNYLMARKGEQPISLAVLIEQAAINMGGTLIDVLLIQKSELEILIMGRKQLEDVRDQLIEERDQALAERDRVAVERDQARNDLGELQEKFNEAGIDVPSGNGFEQGSRGVMKV